MRTLILSLIITLFIVNNIKAQKAGEQITYLSTQGIYQVRYWSTIDSTFHTVTLFPGNKLDLNVKAKVHSGDKDNYIYKYSITNNKNSLRELYTFSIQLESHALNVQSPNKEWEGNYIRWINAVRWVQIHSKSDTLGTLPGKKVRGTFSFVSKDIPGLVYAKASSYWGLGNTIDDGPSGEIRSEVDSLLEANKNINIKTIGAIKLPDTISPTALLDSLNSYLSFSCDTTWIDNKGICQSLQAKLKNVQKQLGKGKTKVVITSLQAFINEVEAQKGKHLTSEGFGLLYYNGEYLLKKLRE
ncbi:MAG TPA: hypothetical protein VKA34_04610 [Balneolales bacterium]|nr:hypothetical protein [Balneolales bacterium]